MRDFLRRRSSSLDSDDRDAFGVTRSLMNAATMLRSSALLFAIFCAVGITVSATYVLIIQKVITADSDVFLSVTILIVLCISAICAIFLPPIASELSDMRRLQDRYYSIGLRTLFEFGDAPGKNIASDVVDRLLSIDPLLRKEVDAGRAKIQYDVDVKAGGLAFSFDAVISGKRRLVLVRSYADQGRKIDEADISKLSEEIRNFIATARPRRVDVLAVWRNDLTEQAVGFSQDDDKWTCPSGCRMLRTMIFASGKGYQIASTPSDAIAKEDAEKGMETPYAIAYATAQKGRARKRATVSSLAMASILILAALAIGSIWINGPNLPGPGGDGNSSMKDHDPIAIMGDSGINNASGVSSGNGTADNPYIIENWSIKASSSNAIDIWGVTAHIVIRNILIETSTVYNATNGIRIFDSGNCYISNVSINSGQSYGIYLDNTTQISIVNSSIKNGSSGICIYYSSGISIINSIVQTSGGPFAGSAFGIYMWQSSNVSIMNSKVETSGSDSLIGYYCMDVSILNSIIPGIWLDDFTNTIISGTNASGVGSGFSAWITPGIGSSGSEGQDGISLYDSENISILNNIASFNYGNGISIFNCTNVDIRDNNASSNGQNNANLTLVGGLSMNSCGNVTVTNNLFMDNPYSVIIINPLNTSIYHNAFVGNGLSAFAPFEGIYISSGSTCQWDNGYPSGGNYYSNLIVVDNFSGPNQNIAGSDGIIDTPLNLGGGNIDRYPHVSPPAI